ncbi:MAG TPA: aspartate--tRNA ligase [Bdellovibrionota bacterium]|jgi:aspartyl-tRNA synthetase|nr:aspartate--tRNA ligase [Bdellovibrionota bacterium]
MASFRTHYLGDLNASLAGQSVKLSGWVNRVRDHGGLYFFDLRDRSGKAQIMVPAEMASSVKLRSEFVVCVEGLVHKRPAGMENAKVKGGDIEIHATRVTVLSEAETPPFSIEDSATEVGENTRLKYRYLDLRRAEVQKNLITRHQMLQASRKFLSEMGFLEIETPILYKSTPEGARDYLVPSRVQPGTFYALPQSPQTLKQLLMISGFDRYFQIARCFRDEDLRADRQPEFTQIDIEASFLEQDEFLAMMETFTQKLWAEVLGEQLPTPFPRILYKDAIEQYGSDKPDCRFDLKLKNISEACQNSQFQVFNQALAAGGAVVALAVKGSEVASYGIKTELNWSRKQLETLQAFVKGYGLKGLAHAKVEADGSWNSPIAKFFDAEQLKKIAAALGASAGDWIFFAADSASKAAQAMGALRLQVAKDLGVLDSPKVKGQWAFRWITEFPLFDRDDKSGRVVPAHHPFTRPKAEDAPILLKSGATADELIKIRAEAYDLALNGFEVAGGSLRIFDSKMQSALFKAIGVSDEEAKEKFGFFVEALRYGTPPHGGMAFGFDRLTMLACGTEAIRDVIAFPKTTSASCLMSDCPSRVDAEQLAELRINTIKTST